MVPPVAARWLVPLLALAFVTVPLPVLADDAPGPEGQPDEHDRERAEAAQGRGPGGRDHDEDEDGHDDDHDEDDRHRGGGEARACAGKRGAEQRRCLAELHEERHQAWRERLEELREEAAEHRAGRFNATNATYQGRFVGFTLDRDACALRNVTLQGLTVLREVAILFGGDDGPEVESRGAVFELECGDGELKLHDNPAAVLRAEGEDGASVRWALAAGIEVNQTHPSNATGNATGNASAPRDVRLRLTAANFTATLRLRDAVALGNGTWTASDGQLVAHGPNLLASDVANRHRHDLDEAKDRGRIGAEVTVVQGDGAPVTDVLAFDDLRLEVTPGDGGVRVVVNATGVGGRTIVVNLDRRTLQGDQVVVRFYDQVNGTFSEVPIIPAQGGLRDVLDPTDDSSPEYWVVRDADGMQVLLSVPQFSTKAFQVQGLPFVVDVPPSVVAGLVAGAVLVAVAAAGLARRRR